MNCNKLMKYKEYDEKRETPEGSINLFRFRVLGNQKDLKRIKEIIEKGFYCSDFLKFNDMNEGGYKKILII